MDDIPTRGFAYTHAQDRDEPLPELPDLTMRELEHRRRIERARGAALDGVAPRTTSCKEIL